MITIKELLYQKVSAAREHCAGCSPRKKSELLSDIQNALYFAYQVEASQELINKLIEAKSLIQKPKRYYDRIPADQLLSEILNVDLKE